MARAGKIIPYQAGIHVPYGHPGSNALLLLKNGTFSRSSTAWALDSDGTLQEYLANELRTEYRSGTGLYLLEGEQTNLLTRSEEFDHADWTSSAGIALTANSDIAPDGATTADTVEDTTTGNENIAQGFSLANENTHTVSIFVKKDNDESRFPGLLVRDLDAGSNILGQMNTKTGETAVELGSATQHTELVGDYWRWSMTFTPGPAGNNHHFRIYPARGTTLGVNDANATGSIVVWGAQLEESTFPTSYIKTVSATATRAADSLTFTAAEVPSQIENGVWSVDVYPYFSSDENPNSINEGTIAFYDTDTGEDLKIIMNDGQVLVRESGDDFTVFMNHSCTWSRHQKLTLIIDFVNETVKFEGFTTGNGTDSMTGVSKGSLTTLQIGGSTVATTRNFNGGISNIRKA